jgi:hypothetical protein
MSRSFPYESMLMYKALVRVLEIQVVGQKQAQEVTPELELE